MPEKCALSHESGVLGRDPRDSCRFWNPHAKKCAQSHSFGLGRGVGGGGRGGGDTIGGGGGRRTENRGSYEYIYIYIYRLEQGSFEGASF